MSGPVDVLAVLDSGSRQGCTCDDCAHAKNASDMREARAAVAELIEADRWVSFDERWPPQSAAFDDQSVVTTDSVLVTNHINGRDRMGRMNHVWFLTPIRSSDGSVVGFTDAGRKVCGLTHWRDAGTALARVQGGEA